MAENSKIQWTTHTFNPWRGCTKVAAGCANCYAETMSKRNQKTLGIWGPNGTRVVASEAMWREPGKWDKAAFSASREHERSHMANLPTMPTPLARPRVFCASLADVFEDWRGEILDSSGRRLYLRADEDVRVWSKSGSVWTTDSTINEYPFSVPALEMGDVRARLVKLWDATPNLNWLVLTKRPENIRRMWHEKIPIGNLDPIASAPHGSEMRTRRENVWLGTSIACQEDADRNIPELLKCRGLAAKLFLSLEPLVGPVDLSEWLYTLKMEHDGDGNIQEVPCRPDINWVIAGGESGPNARPCNIAWIRDIVNQCKEAGVSCFVKQLGANPVTTLPSMVVGGATNGQGPNGRIPEMTGQLKFADPKGGDMSEWPEDLRVREVPT
jgi:protein gp37